MYLLHSFLTRTGNTRPVRSRKGPVFAIIISVLLFSFCLSASAEILVGYGPHRGVFKTVDTDSPDFKRRPVSPNRVSPEFSGITWTITYLDIDNITGVGFDHSTKGADRRARLEDALEYVSSILNETGTLDVLVEESQTDGNGFLAAAGTYYWDTPSFQTGFAFEHIDTESDPHGDFEDINLTVDFGRTWNERTGAPSGSQFDLISVLVHEITHGLGISSLSDSSGNPPPTFEEKVYTTWDEELERDSGSQDLFANGIGGDPEFKGSSSDLISNDVVFKGADATTDFGSSPPAFAPDPFDSGSSLSHFDDDLTAVMTPSIPPGVTKRVYSSFEIAALRDVGWSNASLSSEVWVDFSKSAETGTGTSSVPFGRLSEAIANVAEGGTIKIKGNTEESTTNEMPTINKAMTIEAVDVGETIRIGVLSGKWSLTEWLRTLLKTFEGTGDEGYPESEGGF